jgi:hypothetical protein
LLMNPRDSRYVGSLSPHGRAYISISTEIRIDLWFGQSYVRWETRAITKEIIKCA